ncbi:MAG: hypothetical protein AAF206_14485 [Bacteroidota bacterium]
MSVLFFCTAAVSSLVDPVHPRWENISTQVWTTSEGWTDAWERKSWTSPIMAWNVNPWGKLASGDAWIEYSVYSAGSGWTEWTKWGNAAGWNQEGNWISAVRMRVHGDAGSWGLRYRIKPLSMNPDRAWSAWAKAEVFTDWSTSGEVAGKAIDDPVWGIAQIEVEMQKTE